MRRRPPAARLTLRVLVAGVVALGVASARPPSAAAQEERLVDRIAIRYVSPETGGNARPRFLTERELGFFARIEALAEQAPVEGDDYPERYVRAATDRLVARAMLASLLVQRGSEPPDLPRLAAEARAELVERVGGPRLFEATLKSEGLEEEELSAFLRDKVRATWYVDRVITPVLAVTEDALHEAYRSLMHPFRAAKFEEARGRLTRWLVAERMRTAELEFLQSARARVQITVIATGALPMAGGATGGAR